MSAIHLSIQLYTCTCTCTYMCISCDQYVKNVCLLLLIGNDLIHFRRAHTW